jgi:uncharacterized membrane protein YgdD (TMEM256/DUF423 family)
VATPTSEIVHALEGMGSTAAWGIGAALGLLAVILGYLGVALLSVIKAENKELQQYRYQAFHDLVELIRNLVELIRDVLRGRDTK